MSNIVRNKSVVRDVLTSVSEATDSNTIPTTCVSLGGLSFFRRFEIVSCVIRIAIYVMLMFRVLLIRKVQVDHRKMLRVVRAAITIGHDC